MRGSSVAEIVEWFEWQERQAKFIANNVRGYEFLGLRWRLPFWDKDLVEWWRSVPLSLRIGRGLFQEAYRGGLVGPQLRGIPIYGGFRGSVERGDCGGVLAAASKRSNDVLKQIRLSSAVRQIGRVRHCLFPPETKDSPLGLEECFAGKAATIGQMLDLVGRGQGKWPKSLLRHFKGRKRWTVRQPGSGSNALLASYVLKLYSEGVKIEK